MRGLQKIARQLVQLSGWQGKARRVLGLDVAYDNDRAVGAAVIWDSEKKVVETNTYSGKALFPYIPGYLFIREAPLMLAAEKQLRGKFDVAMVDGHGYAHPRRAGLAVFVGLILDAPTIGIAKGLLTGRVEDRPAKPNPLRIGREIVGWAFPWSRGVFYASPGNRVSVDDVRKIIEELGGGYPTALREAHNLATRTMGESRSS